MADNFSLKDSTNTARPIATDDVAGVHFQRFKLDVGGDGASIPVNAASPLPVADSAASTNLGNISASLLVLIGQTDGLETLLGAVRDRLPAALVGGRLGVVLPSTARAVAAARATGAGTVLAGAVRVSIANVGAANGSAAGMTLRPGEMLSPAVDAPDTLAAISYDATGTEFVVMEVR